MPNRNQLGYQWKHDVRTLLASVGIHLDSREMGAAGDDLFNTRLSIECKNHKEFNISTWLDQCVENAYRSDNPKLPILAVKRRGKGVQEGYAIMRVGDLAALLVYAGLADS